MKTQLTLLLANTYALYLKTQHYHWNVRGPHFVQLHALFEEQYKELASSIDAIAEHIRMQGEYATASFNGYQQLNKIPDGQAHLDAPAMVADLLASHSLLLGLLATALTAAQAANDEVVVDFIIERMGAHQKHQWILGSLNSEA